MKDQTTIKANFKKLTISGVVQMLFVLNAQDVHQLPWLTNKTGQGVELTITGPQETFFVDSDTGEVLDEQASLDELAEQPSFPVTIAYTDEGGTDVTTTLNDAALYEGFVSELERRGVEYTVIEGGEVSEPDYTDLGDEADNDVAALYEDFEVGDD